MGADADTAVVLCRGGQPLQHLIELAECPLSFVDCDLPLDEQVTACGATPAIIIYGRSDDLLALARRLPALALIQIPMAGSDWLDVAALAELGVQVADNNGANAAVVAERTIALIYSVFQQLDQQFASTRAGTWQQGIDFDRPYYTFEGKRIGLVGLGRIGSRVAKRLRGWECEVFFHDIAEFAADYIAAAGAHPLPYDELLQTSDVVSLHVPLNRLTRNMFSDREFGLMQNGTVFINTCRGPVCDEAALIRALQQGRLFGAGMDVTEIEPSWLAAPKSPRFRDMPHGGPAVHDTSAAVLWDDANLYVGFWIEEPFVEATLKNRDDPIYQNNDVEVFIAGQDTYYEFEINAYGTVYEVLFVWEDAYERDGYDQEPDLARDAPGAQPFYGVGLKDHPRGPRMGFFQWGLTGMQSAVHIDATLNDNSNRDRGWIVELALPWSGMDLLTRGDGRAVPPNNGDTWGMDFSRFNQYREAPPAQDNASWCWSPHGIMDSHIPEVFTQVTFSTETVSETRS